MFTADVPTAIARVLEGLLALSGLIAESLVRDAAGASARSAAGSSAPCTSPRCCGDGQQAGSGAADSLVLESVLIAAESIITYRRRYPTRAGVATVLDLLLADRENPRAVAFQLDRIGEALERSRPRGADPPVPGTLAELRTGSAASDTRPWPTDAEERPPRRPAGVEAGPPPDALALDVERIFFVQPAPRRPQEDRPATWESW